MIRRVPHDYFHYCGVTALASIFGLSKEEITDIVRDIRGYKIKRRVKSMTEKELLMVAHRLLRRRGINRLPYSVGFNPIPGRPRPRVNDTWELNAMARRYRDKRWVPVAILSGNRRRMRHIMAYDHRRKRLCDTFSGGKVVPLKDHRLADNYIWGVIMLPEEFHVRN